jgi:hypothetical protein
MVYISITILCVTAVYALYTSLNKYIFNLH